MQREDRKKSEVSVSSSAIGLPYSASSATSCSKLNRILERADGGIVVYRYDVGANVSATGTR